MNRERLPVERPSITRSFSVPYIDEEKMPQRFGFYVIAGLYDDNRLAEIFIYSNRKNDQLSGLLAGSLDTVATMISIGLQYGVPLATFTAKLRHNSFGPAGFTGDRQFHSCTSIFDLVAQWLDTTFPNGKFGGEPPT